MKPAGWLERIALVLLTGGAAGSFASSRRDGRDALFAWALLLPIAVSVFFRFKRLPKPLVDFSRSLGWTLLVVTFLFRWLVMVYPILSTEVVTFLSLLLGYGLSLLATLFLLGAAVFRPSAALYPAIAGALVVASMNAQAALHPFLAIVGAGLFFHLLAGATRPKALLPAAALALGALGVASAIILLLPNAQGKVESLIVEVYVPRATSGLSPHARLGEFSSLKRSKRVVMRVWAARAQKLRGRLFTRFDGRGWSAGPAAAARFRLLNAPLTGAPGHLLEEIPGDSFVLPRRDLVASEGASALDTKIVSTEWAGEILVSPAGVLLVKAPLASLTIDRGAILFPPPRETPRVYGILHSRRAMALPPAREDPAFISECLQTPEDTDPRLRHLAARLARSAGSQEELVDRTVSFVGNECRYALDPGRFDSNQPVAEFLFEKKRGYCEYFASAAAVLLRLQGVPTRYVTGVNVLPSNRQGGHYLVRESDAHAWIEAYFPESGWVELDPTPAAEYEALHADLGGGFLNELVETLKAWWAEAMAQIGSRDAQSLLRWLGAKLRRSRLAWIVLLALALGTLVMGRRAWRSVGPGRRARESAPPREGDIPAELLEWMRQLDRAWEGRGFRRPPSSPPLEHLGRLAGDRVPRELQEVSRQVVDCFYRARFRGDRIDAEELSKLGAAVATLPPAW